MREPPGAPGAAPLPAVEDRRRLPLSERRRRARQAARVRVARATRQRLTEAQRRRDPLSRGHLPRTRRILIATGAMLLSAAVHLGVVALGQMDLARSVDVRQEVAIEVREREPPPPPPPPPPEPEPPEPVKPKVERPAPPPPKAEPPPPEPKAPPPRVVGLSLESTTEVGGTGPSFAVGNTRAGETAEKAVDPQAVPSEAPPPEAAPTTNQVASRIPTIGVQITQPKRKRPSQPPYPETLKAQGIEGQVSMQVTLDSTGKVTKARILKEAPYAEFNEVSLSYAPTEEWYPALRDGVPIPYTLSFMYFFRLADQ